MKHIEKNHVSSLSHTAKNIDADTKGLDDKLNIGFVDKRRMNLKQTNKQKTI